MSKISRRLALTTALFGGAAACAPKRELTPFTANADEADAIFRHGVASGDPSADGFVVWTRVSGADDGAEAASLAYEIADDANFENIVASGVVEARAVSDWTAKAFVRGLAPGRAYHYRFKAGAAMSPAGRSKTLPDGALAGARFAVVSCSNYPFGYFNVYDQIARRDDFDAVIHLGDYIYEYGPDGYGGEVGAKLGRPHDPPHEIVTLADYRTRHAQYKADPCSRAMHAAHPLIAIWDDHETADNSWTGGAHNHQPETEGDWNERKRAALQAYFEWMPIRDPEPDAPAEAIFRSFSYGDLLTVVALETRLMARGEQIDLNVVAPTLRTPEDVEKFRREVLWDPSRDMLGDAQLAFLDKSFRASKAAGQPWRVIANQVTMAEVIAPDLAPHVTEEDMKELEALWDQARAFVEVSKLGLPANFDAWDGYPASREKFYETARAAGADGLIVVTGDTHAWWANDLARRDGTPMGVELGGHSVTSPSPFRKEFLGGRGDKYALLTNKENKSVRYLSGEDHGYIDLQVRRDGADARFIGVDTIESPSYNVFEKAAFAIGKANGVAKFKGAKDLTFKEGWLFR